MALLNVYRDLFEISPVYEYNKELKQYILNPDKIAVNLIIDTVENLRLLKDLLEQATDIPFPNNNQYDRFGQLLKQTNILNYEDTLNGNQVKSLFEQIKAIIDTHNLYFNNISKNKITKIINNQTLKAMYDTSIDPVNLTQSQIPIDAVTAPLKDIAENKGPGLVLIEAHKRTPGNFINKFESITENQVGKDGIGICATGLKAFFALTQYYNRVLNYGTEDEQKRLLFKYGKEQEMLAGVRPIDADTISYNDALEVLASRTNETDPVLVLSALLSLATDNAKELALAKLNAGPATLGMYIFGTAVGIDFNTLADTMMSEEAFILSNAVNSNVYNNDQGLFSISRAMEHFTEKCNTSVFQKFNTTRNIADQNVQIHNPWEFFKKAFYNDHPYFIEENKPYFPKNIITYVNKLKGDLPRIIRDFDALRSKYPANESIYGKQLYNQLIDTVQEYAINAAKVMQMKNLDYFKWLAKGAEEYKKLGQILGINQGIRTDIPGYIQQLKNIKDLIYNETGEVEDKIDLEKFVLDSVYREECIKRYDQFKTAFNILDVISQVPHFFNYIRTLAVSEKEAKESFKFRSTETLSDSLSEYNRDSQTLIRGIQNFIGDYTRDSWLSSKNITIKIPKGCIIFDEQGNQKPATQETLIKLGTEYSNATFRAFVESKVIPNLQNGIIKDLHNSTTSLSQLVNNQFIIDLTQDINTKTISGNASILYTLPINMLPRSESEQALLDNYISEFNRIASMNYEWETAELKSDGTAKKWNNNSIPLVDLFTYYSMIAHDWKLGEKSLVPLLKGFQNTGIIKEFHEFEKDLDKSNKILTRNSIVVEDILPYIVPYDNPYTSYYEYIKHKDSVTKKVRIMQHIDENQVNQTEFNEDMDIYGDIIEDLLDQDARNLNKVGKYEYLGEMLNTNYFTTGNIKARINLVDYENTSLKLKTRREAEVTLLYKDDGIHIQAKKLIVNGKDVLSDFNQQYRLPISYENGKGIINQAELASYIDDYLIKKQNAC